jgi:hypothetical protein
MSYQEKQAIVSLIGTILISAGYCVYIFQKYQAEGVSPTNDLSFWASAILILILVMIVLKIIVYIAFSILNTIVTREEEPGFTDERDKLIDLKATRNFYHVFMAGFVLSMLALAVGQPPFVMFTIIFFSILVAGMILDISQFYFYRRGV